MEILIEGSQSVVDFATTAGGSWAKWDRYITIDGKKAFHIGNICGTCTFFFERMDGANRSIPVEALVSQLNDGVHTLDDILVQAIQPIISNGQYRVVLEVIQPKLCMPADNMDYFCKEQIDLWGLDDFWGLPHHPKTEYYRLQTKSLGEGSGLFEFLVPTFPHSWLKASRVAEYGKLMDEGKRPTVISLGTLDIKQPADWPEGSKINEHWCLTHFILDGHHKAYAAAMANKAITMISFVALDQGVSNADDVRRLFD